MVGLTRRQFGHGYPSLLALILLGCAAAFLLGVLVYVLVVAVDMLLPAAEAMEEQVVYAPAYGQGPFEQLFSLLVPAIGKLLILALPGVAAITATIVHVTFWRRDNRAMGAAPFSHVAIRDKVYWWGRVYGVGAVAVMQGTVELLLGQVLSWPMRVSSVALALVVTGPAARLTFDILRGHAGARVEAGRNGWWRRVYDYLTVQHPGPGEDNDDTLRPRVPGEA